MLENINNYKNICIFYEININSLNDKVRSAKIYFKQINDRRLPNIISVPSESLMWNTGD